MKGRWNERMYTRGPQQLEDILAVVSVILYFLALVVMLVIVALVVVVILLTFRSVRRGLRFLRGGTRHVRQKG